MWLFNGKEFDPTEFDFKDLVGFVYCITDLTNNKKYIGKKNFWSTNRLKPLKGKTRKRVVKKESDWIKYHGSNEEVKLLVAGTVVLAPLIEIMSPANMPDVELIVKVTVGEPLVVVIVAAENVDLIG